jgi:hypothetical protein
MTTLGRILEIKNIDSAVKQALSEFPELSLAQKVQFKAQFVQSFAEENLKENLEMVTAIYPNKRVEKGDTWTKIGDASVPEETFISTYQFKDERQNFNLITGKETSKPQSQNDYTKINGTLTKSSSKENRNTSLQVDRKTGWVINGKINELVSATRETKDTPQSPGRTEQTMTRSIEITYSSQ